MTENAPQCISIVNSLIPKVSGSHKLDLLERKFQYLQKIPNSDKDKDEVLSQIYNLSPDDFDYRLKYV